MPAAVRLAHTVTRGVLTAAAVDARLCTRSREQHRAGRAGQGQSFPASVDFALPMQRLGTAVLGSSEAQEAGQGMVVGPPSVRPQDGAHTEDNAHNATDSAGQVSAWDALSAETREGILLATEARTLGSQGRKCGNDVGVVLVAATSGATPGGPGPAWRVLAWGCARTLELPTARDEASTEGRAGEPDQERELEGELGEEGGTSPTPNPTSAPT